jgi:hypothetical protein
MGFIEDIRNIQKVPEFAGGNNNQRTKLNGLVKAVEEIVDAANRHAPPAPGGGGENPNEMLLWINDAGTARQAIFQASFIDE